MKLLKSRGLNISTYHQSMKLLKKLPRNLKTRKTIRVWLDKHIKIQKKLAPYPLPISSDIIESLFGKFKNRLERSPQSDMNRSVLLIPLLCGALDKERLSSILKNTKHKEVKEWEEENIPYSVRKQRIKFFNNDSHKVEMDELA